MMVYMMELNFNILYLPCSFGLLYIIVYNLYVLPCCCPVPSAAGSRMATWLHSQAITRLEEGLRPRTRTAYMAAFRQFLAFVIVMKFFPAPQELLIWLLFDSSWHLLL